MRVISNGSNPIDDFNFIASYEPKVFKEVDRKKVVNLNGSKISRAKYNGGYFLPGEMSKLERSNENVINKSLLVIDIDDTELSYNDLIFKVSEKLGDYNFLIYPTVSHTEGKTKARLIVQPERALNQLEYKYIVNQIGKVLEIDIDNISKTIGQHQGLPITYEDIDFKSLRYVNNDGEPYPINIDILDIEESTPFRVEGTIPDGERNSTLFKMGCSMQAKGYSDKTIEVALREENQAKCNPPLEEEEVLNMLNSLVKRYEKGSSYNVSVNESGEVEGPIPGVYKSSKGYMFGKHSKNGEIEVTRLSNFYIEVLEMIRGEEETFLKCLLHSKGYQVEKTFNVDVFNNKAKFQDSVSDFNFFYKGDDRNLQDIKYIESQTDYKITRGMNNLGFHKVDGENYFITNTKALKSDLSTTDKVGMLEDRVQIKSNILEFEGITKEELEKISPLLFNFNSLEITASMLGTIILMLAKEKLFSENVRAKHLILYGEAGSGKSETRRNIINPFMGLDEKDSLECSNVTQFSLNKLFESSDSFPVVLEEYKPWKMSQKSLDLVSSSLRNSYDRVSAIRGTKNQGLIRYPLKAPCILVGEEGQEETATRERSMIVNFSKLESRKADRRENFIELSKIKNLLSKLGRSVLNEIIQSETSQLIAMRNEIIKRNLATLKDDRVNDTVINAILGIFILGKVYKKLGVDFEASTKVKVADIVQAINNNTFIEVLDSSHTTKTVVDNTIEMIDLLIGRGVLIEGLHYTYVNNDSELALNIPLLFDETTKYKKDYSVNTEILSSRNQFTKQLRKTSYFLDYKTVKFKNPNDLDSKVVGSYVLDIRKLSDRNLELNNINKK